MSNFCLKSFQCLLHPCKDHVRKHLVEEYVGNGAEVCYKFCAGLFGKHREQSFPPSIEEAKQFHQKALLPTEASSQARLKFRRARGFEHLGFIFRVGIRILEDSGIS